MTAQYSFRAKPWKHKGPAGWHFVTLPKKLSQTIRKKHGLTEEGWGRLKATALIGQSKWQTSIWFDTKANAYLLPLKSTIRKKEKISVDTSVAIKLMIQQNDPRKMSWLRER